MLDVIELANGKDMGVADTPVMKAANVLSVQIGSLEYLPQFGVDLRFFLQSDVQFQNESFKTYLVERLIQHQINVSEVIETLETLFAKYTFMVSNSNNPGTGLIR